MTTEELSETPAGADNTTNVEAPAPAKTPSTKDDGEPDWLPDRLARERKKILKTLGVDDVDTAKKILDEAKRKSDAEKSAELRAAEVASKLTASEQRAQELLDAVTAHAAEAMSDLTAEQKAAVEAVAGEDPAKQIKTIKALRPTWVKPKSDDPPAAKPTPVKVPDTAPGANAPKDGVQKVDHASVYKALKASNPVAAARYGEAHASEIYPPKP